MLKNLIKWSKSKYSNLPWRENRTLYGTLVSEITLQQTTVSTVLNHYQRFLKTFSKLDDLAKSSDEKLLLAWKGLGYYRRAKNLKIIAQEIIENYQSEFPSSIEELKKIKGIGPYTANALVGIGMDKKALAVDANLERVLARFYGIKNVKGPSLQTEIYHLFYSDKILYPFKGSYRELNEALMDLGRIICKSRSAHCEICPLQTDCVANKNSQQLEYPVVKKTISLQHELHLLRLIVKKKDHVLGYLKPDEYWLAGQWELPTFIIKSTDEKLTQYPAIPKNLKFKDNQIIKTGITKYNIINYVHELSYEDWKKIYFPFKTKFLNEDESSHLSTASHKCLKKMLKSREKV